MYDYVFKKIYFKSTGILLHEHAFAGVLKYHFEILNVKTFTAWLNQQQQKKIIF